MSRHDSRASCRYLFAVWLVAVAACSDDKGPERVSEDARSATQVPAEDALHAARHFREGQRHFAERRIEAAYASFRSAVSLDPHRREYRRHEADVALSMRRFSRATEILSALLEEAPDDFETRRTLAVARYRAGDYEGLRGVLSWLECHDPVVGDEASARSLSDAWLMLGLSQEKSDRQEEAVASFTRARVLTPGRPEIRRALGRVYMQLGRDEEAARELRPAARESGVGPQIPLLFARALEKSGQVNEAAAIYYKLVDHPHTSDKARIGFARCVLGQGDKAVLARAAALLEESLAAKPLSIDLLFALDKIYVRLGRNEDSTAILDRHRRVKDWRDENTEKLRDHLRKIKEAPQDPAPRLALVGFHVGLLQWEEARQVVDHLLHEVDPDCYEGLAHLARLLRMKGDHRGAYWEALKMSELDPDDPRGPVIAAWSLRDLGDLDKAVACARRAMASKRQSFEAVEVFVATLTQRGGHEEELRRWVPIYQDMRNKEDAKRAGYARKRQRQQAAIVSGRR